MRGVFITPTQSRGYLRWGMFSLRAEQAAVTQGLPPVSCSSPQLCLQVRDEKPCARYCTECVSLASPDPRAAVSLSTASIEQTEYVFPCPYKRRPTWQRTRGQVRQAGTEKHSQTSRKVIIPLVDSWKEASSPPPPLLPWVLRRLHYREYLVIVV